MIASGSLSTAPSFVACVTSFSVLAIIKTVPDFNNDYRLKNHIYIWNNCTRQTESTNAFAWKEVKFLIQTSSLQIKLILPFCWGNDLKKFCYYSRYKSRKHNCTSSAKIERISILCPITETNIITSTNHNRALYHVEPMRTQTAYNRLFCPTSYNSGLQPCANPEIIYRT